jgi:non-heme chloroperoxidase
MAANCCLLPLEVFDGFRAALLADRSQFFKDVPSGPFFGFNRPGPKVSQGMIDAWWLQGMLGGHKNTYECIKAFSEADFTEDLKKFDVPTLIVHGDDDQVVPIDAAGRAPAKIIKHAKLIVYPALPTASPIPTRINSMLTCLPSSRSELNLSRRCPHRRGTPRPWGHGRYR